MSSPVRASSISFAPPKRGALSHIPGEEGWPIIGHTLTALADPKHFIEKMGKTYGLVFRTHLLGETSIVLLGPEANELVLQDNSKGFSCAGGWDMILGRLFPGGLLMRDFEDHRRQRRALSVAFKAGPMRSYLAALNSGIAHRVAQWKKHPAEMLCYPAMKRLTLDLAATSFLGTEIGAETDNVNCAFIDMVTATVAPIRRPWPGTAMARGVRARKRIAAYFSAQIPLRRAQAGEDLFSQLCRTTDENGALLADEDIVDHMSFFLMAAHDTLSSSLTGFVEALAVHPDWQERLREEVVGLGLKAGEALAFEQLESMPLTEMAFKEALRMRPPVPSILRRATRDFTFKGYTIPAGTLIGVNPLFTHHMPEIWPNPDRFDPLRFTNDAQRGRHRFAWVPFGGGAHMCLGLNFASMQAKCFAVHFLRHLRVRRPADANDQWQMWPIPKPKDGARIVVTTVQE